MPQIPRLWCADCGSAMHQSKGSLPQGKARCHPCRQAQPANGQRLREHVCSGCGVVFLGARRSGKPFCTIQCANLHHNLARRVRDASDRRVKRFQREMAAPGLSRRDRDKLLALWRSQSRACAYCPNKATTIDHVLPLVRGGTNFEGNLVPCCKSCNSSKAGWTVIEWRTGRRLSAMTAPLRWKVAPAKTPRALVAVQQELRLCPVCMSLHERPVYCSLRCCRVANERRKTERNRKPARTACPQGHPYTEDNRRIRVRVRGGVERVETECRACNREHKARRTRAA